MPAGITIAKYGGTRPSARRYSAKLRFVVDLMFEHEPEPGSQRGLDAARVRWADHPAKRVAMHARKMPVGRAADGVELLLQSRPRWEYGRKARSCHVPVVLEQAPDVEILAVQDVHKLLSDAERVRPRPPLQFGVGKQIKVSERDGSVALQMLEQISRSLRIHCASYVRRMPLVRYAVQQRGQNSRWQPHNGLILGSVNPSRLIRTYPPLPRYAAPSALLCRSV